jgi:hypothetical protein
VSLRVADEVEEKPEERRPSRLVALFEAVETPRLALPETSWSRGMVAKPVTVCAGVVAVAGMVTVTGTWTLLPKTCPGVMNCVPE